MDEVLSGALRDSTYGWLDRLAAVIDSADPASLAALAQTELVRMLTAWRALLAEHEPDQDGRCPRCTRWRRSRGYHCTVWVTAHQQLVVNDLTVDGNARHTLGTGRHGSAC